MDYPCAKFVAILVSHASNQSLEIFCANPEKINTSRSLQNTLILSISRAIITANSG